VLVAVDVTDDLALEVTDEVNVDVALEVSDDVCDEVADDVAVLEPVVVAVLVTVVSTVTVAVDAAVELTVDVAVEDAEEDALEVAEDVNVDVTLDVAVVDAVDTAVLEADEVADVVAVVVTVVTSHRSVLLSYAAMAALMLSITAVHVARSGNVNRTPNEPSHVTEMRVPGKPSCPSENSATRADSESAASCAVEVHVVSAGMLRKWRFEPDCGQPNTSCVYSPKRELVLSRQN
jgi:hypothetical protein